MTTCAAPASAASTSPRWTRETESTLPLVQQRRALVERVERVGDRLEHLVLDLDERGRLAGGVPGLGGDRGEHVADVRGLSPSATSWRQSRVSEPCVRSPGTSAAVTTATTPGWASAFDVSMRSTRARGWSEKRSAPWSIPGASCRRRTACRRARARVPW